ncbi:hypothetical protein GQ54DRAFT_131151 [Martensiomyces pterosporus]|nr:hypothetical protein GQ54DRAFT_131151 [Martensiomyces pterosporus]
MDTEQHLSGRDGWPRRRSPLPATLLHGAISPRRRKSPSALSPKPSLSSLHFGTPVSDSSDFWETETISSSAGTLVARSLSADIRTGDSGDDYILSSQIKQQKRTISELTRQLDNREAEIAEYLQQIQSLKASVEDARRRAHADRQAVVKCEEQIHWHEEQLRVQQDEVSKLKRAHQAAANQAERRHQSALGRVMHKLERAESETMKLASRIKDLSSELEEARLSKEDEQSAKKLLSEKLLSARLAAAHTTEIAAALIAKLDERKRYVGELERQVRSLQAIAAVRSSCISTESSSSMALAPGPVLQAGSHSLYAEIEKATRAAGSANGEEAVRIQHQPSPLPAPLPSLRLMAREWPPALAVTRETSPAAVLTYAPLAGAAEHSDMPRGNDMADNASGKRPIYQPLVDSSVLLHTAAVAPPAPAGKLYWLAVYLHLIWSFYVRLWVRPIWCVTSMVLSAVLSCLVLRPLEQLIPRHLLKVARLNTSSDVATETSRRL